MKTRPEAAGTNGPRHIHQFVARLAWGDAVGNQVRYLQSLLRSWGHVSEIYAEQWDDTCRDQVRPARDYPREASRDSVLIVHHSFESRMVPMIARSPGRKLLVYHNVTPARLFEGFERKVAIACDAARAELLAMREHMDAAFAYSRFSAEELAAAGYRHVAVLPFAIDWSSFDTPPDATLQAELDDGCANILFVGRAVPSKRMDDVLRVFTAYQRLYQPRSRLLIAGALNRDSPYGAFLLGLKDLLGPERVHFLGRVSAAQLSACFSVATAYVSMSRHEGFGVPLLEAMYRGVPVVAHAAAAVPETMGGAGIATFSRDPMEVAQLLAVLERSGALRTQVIDAQRARVAAFSQDTVAEQVREALSDCFEGRMPALPSPPAPARIELICPGYSLRPDAPMSRLARALASRVPEARVLALRPRTVAPRAAPGPEDVEGPPVWHFTADQPVGLPAEPLPGSSALETAARASSAPHVYLGVDTEVASTLLPLTSAPAWGVRATSEARAEGDASHRLGARLFELAPEHIESTVEALFQSLSSRGGPLHERG
ncbi:glycosyltransferase [Myxococcaceae bacterium JPH2]|nr:glycosyltransferase [Myxococcaceae bacterium JPH2]